MERLQHFIELRSRNGVTLRQQGKGTPVFVFPGMEGSGESCLHLVVPVVSGHNEYSIVLVDYSQEQHHTFEALIETIHGLISEMAGNGSCLFWAQSFGNLLATSVAAKGGISVERFILVSPFTELPPWKIMMGVLPLYITPNVIYQATIKPLGQYVFGPAGDQADHIFFDALKRSTVPTVRRRTNWLSGRNFQDTFTAISVPAHVCLGERDRLVNLPEQRAFFEHLEVRNPLFKVTIIPGSGHVVLPSKVVEKAIQILRNF